ncbi:MAG TPA: hypothetical protein VE177_04670, partial [Candidatus Binatus sp.]|nr:hypothetical protein [Candidatus Binatus sp.]
MPGADPYGNTFPKLLQLNNGTTWMIWQKNVQYGQVWMMAQNGFGWGGQIPLLSNNTWDDIAPSIAQLNNGTVILTWSRGSPGSISTYNLYMESYSNSRWSGPIPLVTTAAPNFDPVLAKLYNGSVMMVWSRAVGTGGNGELYYRLLSNGVWMGEHPIPNASTGTYDDKLPSIVQAFDGRIWIVFESNRSGTPQIWYTTLSGMTWSLPNALTNTTEADEWPTIGQDRNGSLWIFWTREVPNGTQNGQTVYQRDVYSRFSISNGASW